MGVNKETPLVQRVEIITRLERRRRWTEQEKRRLVAGAYAPGVTVSQVARQHDAATSCLFARHAEIAKAIDYMLKRWAASTRLLGDGRICLSNNAPNARCAAWRWLFAGSNRGGECAAAIYSLIVTAKLNDVDPQAWLADVLRRINDHPALHLDELLPWNWKARAATLAA